MTDLTKSKKVSTKTKEEAKKEFEKNNATHEMFFLTNSTETLNK